MNGYLSSHVPIVALTFFLAGIVKGVAGMGLPTVAMGVLSAIMSPVGAASLLVIPSFVTNFWQLFTGPNFLALMKRLWLMMLGIAVGTLAGSWFLTSANTEYASVGLGSALILYAMHGLWAKPLSVPARLERLLAPVIGLTTGVINGGTGVFTLPAVPPGPRPFQRRSYPGTGTVVHGLNNCACGGLGSWRSFSSRKYYLVRTRRHSLVAGHVGRNSGP
jgi:uncharacterized membrane protein YfcA